MTAAPDKATLALVRMALAGTDRPEKLAQRSAGFRAAAEAYEIVAGHNVSDEVLIDLWGLVQREGALAEGPR